MKQKVLLLGPEFKGLHNDIIRGLTELGYNVDYISIEASMRDPYNKRGRFRFPKALYDILLKKRWTKVLNNYPSKYDILLVIDGQSFHPVILSVLKQRNQDLYSANYLFDSNSGVYDFCHNFKYFDKVFTFDRKESIEMGITCLPIYWIPETNTSCDIDVFGVGGYNLERYSFFKKILEIVNSRSLRCFIKLFTTKISNEFLYSLKYKIREIMGLPRHISLEEYHSEIITFDSLSPDEYRSMMARSRIIIDTSPIHQSGLTARFMWALGLGKKIITTNEDVRNYSFYSPDNIYIANTQDISSDDIFDFIEKRDFITNRSFIDCFRIDNWLKTILSYNE